MNKLKKMFGGNSKDKESSSSQSQSQPQSSQPPPTTTSQPATTARQGGSSTKKQGVLMSTNKGDITIFMFRDETPKTCQNFVGLADAGRYDGVIFHRVISGFMLQGGDPTGTGRGGESIWGGKFEDEIVSSLTHSTPGILSMANSGPGTNGSQFFITLGPTPHLNGKHTVFGQVAGGMEVVEAIGRVATDEGDRPLEDVVILSAKSFEVDDN